MGSDGAKHAFISYVKEDAVEVDKLCRILDRSGIPYWRDRKDLAPGDAWKAKIRSAIRDGSLIFLACFSSASRSRDKSYMNEELSLAVDEFRQRPPGATWLIPVRFDDGEVPEWDLGGGRTLNDLNYSDLFGDDYAAEAAALVTAVSAVMGVSAVTATQTVASVETAAASERPMLMRRATKEMLLDPSRRIALDDLVQQETRTLIAALEGPNALSLSRPANMGDDGTRYVVDRARTLVDLVEPLCWSMQVAGRWATQDTVSMWARSLRSIAIVAAQQAGGLTALIALRSLPALCLLVTSTIATHSSGRWDNLQAITMQSIPDGRGGNEYLLDVVTPWAPFDSSEFVPNLLARAQVDGSDLEAQAASISTGQTPKLITPVSEWLVKLLRPVFEEQFSTEAEYERAFNAAETFLGVLSQDTANVNEDSWRNSSHWYGRDIWQDRYSRTDAVDALSAEFEAAGRAWGPLQAGLFGGDTDRARKALSAYGENFKRVAQQRS